MREDMRSEIDTNQKHPQWPLEAIAAPLLQTAAGCPWLTVLLTGLFCIGIIWGQELLLAGYHKTAWIRRIQGFWAAVVLGDTMHWSRYCWQKTESVWAAPLLLLALALWLTGKGKPVIQRTNAVMRLFLMGLLGVVLFSALKEIKLVNLKPVWQMKDGSLVTIFLLPALLPRWEKTAGKGKLLGCALLLSIITTGMITVEAALSLRAPFYEMSRSLTFLGSVKRFESLAASAMTIGYFLLFRFLLSAAAADGGEDRRMLWFSAVAGAGLYLSGLRINSSWMAAISVLIWGVLPVLVCLTDGGTGRGNRQGEKKEKTIRKMLDKRKRM